ncbi:zinc finger MYM-type protein 1 [Scomber scombrus]|uniref:Zinc finger MYM-type protein 1 n=1 Tax=Scomber scombrus TaxID=13677 RepID=A0AAV1PYQ9_SCOSC
MGLDRIGPLRVTGRGNQYVMTMTDLYTKWVTAEPLRCKTACEVSAAIVGKMYTFSMVRRIITDQGKEFVNEDERTNQNIKRALRKYVNENHDDWDLHLPAVVYGINTALQVGFPLGLSPNNDFLSLPDGHVMLNLFGSRLPLYFLMYNRHPHLPEVMNACPMGDAFEVGDPEEGIDTIVTEMKALNDKVLSNIEHAQARQQKSYGSRKRKSVRVCSINVGDDVLISDVPNKSISGRVHIFNTKLRSKLSENEAKRLQVSVHNVKVRENREILKDLIRATYFLAKQELAFRGNDENEGSSNRGNYVELLNVLAEKDERLETHLQISTFFTGTSNRIQNDLIQAVSDTLRHDIQVEVNAAPFVSVQVDEITDATNKAQLSVILRYVNQSEVKEAFLGFTDVSSDRKAAAITEHILAILESYNCTTELVAQTYDGAAVMASQLNGVQAKIKQVVPEAFFIHCYAHKLNLLLSYSAKSITDCKVLFKTIEGLASFFSKSVKRTQFLDAVVKHQIPWAAPMRWSSHSRINDTMTVPRRQRGDFESFYAKFEEKCQLLGLTDPSTRNVQPIKEHRRELFHNIYEDVSTQMKNRFDHYGQLSFFSLVDLRRFDKMSSSFDDRSLKSLEEAYAKHFDFIRLKADLTGLYSSLLISTTASVERSFSALKRIKTYSRNRTGEERLSSLAVISIEAEHLVRLHNKRTVLQ